MSIQIQLSVFARYAIHSQLRCKRTTTRTEHIIAKKPSSTCTETKPECEGDQNRRDKSGNELFNRVGKGRLCTRLVLFPLCMKLNTKMCLEQANVFSLKRLCSFARIFCRRFYSTKSCLFGDNEWRRSPWLPWNKETCFVFCSQLPASDQQVWTCPLTSRKLCPFRAYGMFGKRSTHFQSQCTSEVITWKTTGFWVN